MLLDKKKRGKRSSKRQFHGNRFRKQLQLDCNKSVESAADESESDSENRQTACRPTEQSTSGSAASATPTRSERKLLNLYDLPGDSSEKCSSGESSYDSSDDETDVEDRLTQELGGYRLIDVDKLNQNRIHRFCASFAIVM